MENQWRIKLLLKKQMRKDLKLKDDRLFTISVLKEDLSSGLNEIRWSRKFHVRIPFLIVQEIVWTRAHFAIYVREWCFKSAENFAKRHEWL